MFVSKLYLISQLVNWSKLGQISLHLHFFACMRLNWCNIIWKFGIPSTYKTHIFLKAACNCLSVLWWPSHLHVAYHRLPTWTSRHLLALALLSCPLMCMICHFHHNICTYFQTTVLMTLAHRIIFILSSYHRYTDYRMVCSKQQWRMIGLHISANHGGHLTSSVIMFNTSRGSLFSSTFKTFLLLRRSLHIMVTFKFTLRNNAYLKRVTDINSYLWNTQDS